MSNDRIVIIGAGMAGAATAYFLAERGRRNLCLLEKEKIAGTQSTGRNAAILRTMIPDPLLNRIACTSAEFYLRPRKGSQPNRWSKGQGSISPPAGGTSRRSIRGARRIPKTGRCRWTIP